jgi:hypothetical protein
MNKPELYSESNEATYCPEDNKLRLYVGRVPRGEYLALKAEGWTSTPKQTCDFVAVWTEQRENTALSYAGYIGDEDQSPTDRAADRAERFAGYRDKRREEAHGYAYRFESSDQVHGYQSQERAERAAARHERIGVHAYNQWEKAEYWQARTAGVISHALYLCSPSVRLGRIKEIETELRKHLKSIEDYNKKVTAWRKVLSIPNDEKRKEIFEYLAGNSWFEYEGKTLWTHYTSGVSMERVVEMYLNDNSEITNKTRFEEHCTLRLQYERQMIDAVGGMAGEEEIKVGGRFCGWIVYKVNKSNTTGRVTTIECLADATKYTWREEKPVLGYYFRRIDVERKTGGSYTAPVQDDINIVEQVKAEIKSKTTKKTVPLINPTIEDAKRLQAIFNEKHKARFSSGWGHKDCEPYEMNQATYSNNSGGSYSPCEVIYLDETGDRPHQQYYGYLKAGVCRVRAYTRTPGSEGIRVIVLTDQPQKSLPISWPIIEEVKA